MTMLTPPRSTGWTPPAENRGETASWVPSPPPPSTAGRSRPPQRVWPWIALAVGAALAGLVSLTVLGVVLAGLVGSRVGSDAAGSEAARVVLSEDFSAGPGPFDEYADQGFTAGAQAGTYVMSSDDLQFTDWVTALMPRADILDVRARVSLADDAEPAAEAGVTVEGDQGGYAFTVSTGSGAQISRITPAEDMAVVAFGSELARASGEVRLTVEPTPGGTTLVRGYLDGRPVAEYVDTGQVGGFTEVGFAVYADTVPVTAQFDDLVVRVAGEW